jgi:hypothetical protein
MRGGISVDISAANGSRLEAVTADRNSLQKHVRPAGIMRRTGKSKPYVGSWQEHV